MRPVGVMTGVSPGYYLRGKRWEMVAQIISKFEHHEAPRTGEVP